MVCRCDPRLLAVLFLSAGLAYAQYPPGGYPPGGYPPGGGRSPGGIPMPGRKGSKPQKADQNQPLPNFRGRLKQMDAKSITLELDDNRVLEFKRTDKTKFYKNGDELKSPTFAAGDQISVEGPQDPEGYLTAVNVYWEKGATATAAKDGGAVDTWKDAPPAAAEKATEVAPPPAKVDPEDPGRPRLQRGKPADTAREHAPPAPEQTSPPQQTAANSPPEILRADAPAAANAPVPPGIRRGDDDAVSIPQRAMDPLIRKATEAALDFTETLPDYVCQEIMSRYQSETRPANWQPLDVITAAVVYEKGKEDYRDLSKNGKPVKGRMEDLSGAWSTGEFGTVLIDLFSPATAAAFHYHKDARAGGVNAKVYEFDVTREHSHWTIHQGSQTYAPAYKGAVWIDPATARVLRIEMQAYGFPDEFPTDHVESATDYEYIRLGDAKQYLLPVHAETLGCQRGSNLCSRNSIDFRNYHKYSGESTIKFGDIKEVKQ